MQERIERGFWLVDLDGVRHFPVRMRNRSTGLMAFRVSEAGNRVEDGEEVIELDELVDRVVNRSFAMRAVPESDPRAPASLVKLGRRKMVGHGRA